MRKILLLGCAFMLASAGIAQDRVIRMPEEPVKSMNIAENNTGYWCSIEVNGGSTLMENHRNVALVNAEFTNGYRFNEWLKVGAGIGVMYYPNNNNVRDTKNHLSMPLFINARGNMLSEEIRRTVPYWSVSIGTSIPDGFFLTPTVGLRVGEKRSAFLVGISYTLRHLKTYPGSMTNFSGAMVKLGYEF